MFIPKRQQWKNVENCEGFVASTKSKFLSPMDDEAIQGFHDVVSCLIALYPDFFQPPLDNIQKAHY